MGWRSVVVLRRQKSYAINSGNQEGLRLIER